MGACDEYASYWNEFGIGRRAQVKVKFKMLFLLIFIVCKKKKKDIGEERSTEIRTWELIIHGLSAIYAAAAQVEYIMG